MSNLAHVVCSAMELPDIHVRVLFDFEYTTKDGIEVKIKEGERLYLIKRTNQDWWQVIRNSGRPFYVPTTYVEEIPRTNTWSESDANIDGLSPGKQRNQAIENYRMRSCSVESQQTHENHKVKPTVPKRTIFDTNAKRILVSEPVAPLKSRIPSERDEDSQAVYVNISKQNVDPSSSENLADAVHKDDLAIKNNVDRLIENISNNLMSVDEDYLNGYSHVTVRTCSLSKGYEGQLSNLSNSLEELTQQIELKAKIIGATQKPNLDEFPKSDQSEAVQPKGLNQTSSFRQLYESPRRHQEDRNKLQYSGSFKTKHECERLNKNYIILGSMREEESASVAAESSRKDRVNGKLNDDNNSNTVNKLALKESNAKMLSEEDGSDRSSNVTSEDVSISLETHVSPDRVTLSSAGEQNDMKLSRLKHSFDSSGDDSDKHASYVNSRLTLSDKGSTDSLLDVDTHYSIQEGSVCTTASDSLLQTSDTSEECLPNILRDELSPEEAGLRKKAALKRNNRVEYRARYPIRSVSPPIPEDNQAPTRELFDDWCEYLFIDGRIFFYNSKTGEKSWKPPRRRCNTDEKSSRLDDSTSNLCSGSSSPFAEIDDNAASLEHSDSMVPIGWRLETDYENRCQCYININTGAKWFSSNDEEGRVYYFEENSSESSWTLPTQAASSSEKLEEHSQSLGNDHVYSNVQMGSQSTITSNELSLPIDPTGTNNNRITKSKSMILIENKNEDPPVPVSFALKNWPQLSDGQMCILKAGTLNKSKITEHGKRLRKNWSTSHVVLTELFLLFFKDSKSFNAMQKPGAAHRPEMSVDLNGALIDRGDKISSRKNVYIISTVLGLQVLIQHDCTQEADNWLLDIQSAIKNLPSGFDSCPRLTRGPVNDEETVPDIESKKSYKVTRTKSVKTKNKDGSIEDLAVSSAERQTKIKARLKKFFHRRPTMELLVKKGIYRDEPAFGCYLDKVVTSESPKVPLFVQRCISCIEKSDENMKTDGLYRASGNLSQVQKIRLQVDQNNLSVIEDEEDVHVLTGALKLFFRELKEPLIPYHLFHKAIKASHNSNKKEKNSQFREITKVLPPANYDTLKFLLQHLLKVTKYKEFNRMHIPNLAIVFGPTLMWPEQESNNMALDLMQQNLVIECLLLEYDNIFR